MAFSAEIEAESSSDASIDSQDIVVTANRREENIQSVPAAVTAVGGDALLLQGIQSAGSIERVVPNLIANGVTGRVQPRWYIRGVGSQDPGVLVVSPVGVYVDDVYLNSPYAQGFPLFDLERVEVVRGPQGTLWGKNTTGGAINFVSRKPDYRSDGYASVEIGNYQSRIFEGATDVTVIPDKLAIRIAGRSEANGGWVESATTRKDVGKLNDDALRLSLRADLSETVQLTAIGRYRNYRGPNTYFIGVAAPTGVTKPGDVGHIDRYTVGDSAADNYDNVENFGGQIQVDADLGGVSLISITAYDDLDRAALQNVDAFNYTVRAFAGIDQNQFSQEFRLVSDERGTFNWIVGAHYFHENLGAENNRAIFPNPSNTQSYRSVQIDQKTDSYAIFGNATWSISDRLRITAGLRQTWETKKIDLNAYVGSNPSFSRFDPRLGTDAVTTPLVVGATQDEKKSWDGTTWDLTPQFDLADNALLFLRFARGFRSGGFNGGAFIQSAVATVDPETVTDYEAGLKSTLFDGKLIANLTAFYYDYENIQANVLTTGPAGLVSRLRNAGKGRAKGFEVELKATPIEGLSLYGNFGFLDSKYTDFETGGAPANGNSFANAPRYTASLGAEYRIDIGDGHAILPQADWSYRSTTYFTSNAQNDPNQAQDGYGIGNLSLSFLTRDDRIRVTGFVRNVGNEKYLLLGLPYLSGFYTYVYGQPRTYGGSVAVRF
ncbi:TonB-dependent receptor [Sphingomonas sp. DBB INV C78]|uniref:TonB-dependent receptor n=1 Tax=Sphingomonas sp. DBB INV C78 TaxID=3349434 RepID=UPI0036D3B6F2